MDKIAYGIGISHKKIVDHVNIVPLNGDLVLNGYVM